MARSRPRLDRAREDKGIVSIEDLVTAAKEYLPGWVKTLGEAGVAKEVDGKVVEAGNVTAAVAGLKLITDYLSQTQQHRAEQIMARVAKARSKAVKELKE